MIQIEDDGYSFGFTQTALGEATVADQLLKPFYLNCMNSQLLSKPAKRQIIPLLVTAAVITGATTFYGISQFNQTDKSSEVPAVQVQQITALGRLEPISEVVRVSTPVSLNNDRMAQLLVQRGDRVKAGQAIGILASRDRIQATLLEAQKQVKVAQANLAQIQAGVKQGEIEAQQAEIARLEAERQGNIASQTATVNRLASELQNAETEYNRYQSLFQEGAISASQRDSKRLTFETAQRNVQEAEAVLNRTRTTTLQELKRARATLNQIAEVRPVDVQVAQAEVERAIAAVKQAEANLAEAYIRSPIAGHVLEVNTKVGETVGDNGIVELGQTDQMQVVAEVYQTDIANVRQGQQATITGESFVGEVRGSVDQIGLQVSQQEVVSGTPGENLDRRIVEVRIHLTPEDSKRVAKLTNLQVQVAIKL